MNDRPPKSTLRTLPNHGAAHEMEPVYAQTTVIKRLSASQPGAVKLAQRFGGALVCVRYRHDAQGCIRYTTVELVVDRHRSSAAPTSPSW